MAWVKSPENCILYSENALLRNMSLLSVIQITSLNTLYHRFQWFSMKSRKARWNPSEARMKSANADEIKSVLIFRRSRISSRSDFIHRRWIYSVRKDGFSWKDPTFAIDKCGVFSGAGEGIWTPDLLITNQLHYPCATPAYLNIILHPWFFVNCFICRIR